MTSPLTKVEVRIPECDPSQSAKRKRGGQPGNSNRLTHGRYTRAFRARHAIMRALVRKADNLAVKVTMVARSRAALARKLARNRQGKSLGCTLRVAALRGATHLSATPPPRSLLWRFVEAPSRAPP